MTDQVLWEGRVGASWAQEWRRTDRSFNGLTDTILGAARAASFTRALDIGCGAGEISLALAREHTRAEITGIDVSKRLIDVARNRGVRLPNLQFATDDAAGWSPDAWQPDLLISRHGVMFFANPVDAFANLAAQAAEDARLIFSCFRSPSENPWAQRVRELLPADPSPVGDPYAAGPFAFADPAYVESTLARSGWTDVVIEPADFAYIAGAGENALDDAVSYFQRIGPAAAAAAELPDTDREAFAGRLRAFLRNYQDGELVAMKGAAWLVRARKG
ncbi:Trans-aconitate 2-methyltransferase [Alteripontixanthobacter maritimus]|uniref:Trans-aconitate 2-methyltransferase n=1 Tax=Alteripontixanthobacter maritimus TaxID=2161824 RepID=A0A369QAF0_9SPHN|nr:class I SAM-dependent methyltransferase [Alteripontixanthobacter maritimus]RDC60217.1 Trans-aconitate 2-methyltransferase [Alteripontixanthobacter maritimus]